MRPPHCTTACAGSALAVHHACTVPSTSLYCARNCTVHSALYTGGEQLFPVRRRSLSQLDGASCFLVGHCYVVPTQDTRGICSSFVALAKLVVWACDIMAKMSESVVHRKDGNIEGLLHWVLCIIHVHFLMTINFD